MKNPTDLIASCQSSSVGRFTLFLCCVCLIGFGHPMVAQDFGKEWIRYRHPLGDPEPAALKEIVTDAAGNSYVIGQTESATTGLNYLTLKYSPSGEKLWQQEYDHLVENGDDFANAVAVDHEGSVYVTGSVLIDNEFTHDIRRRYTLTVKYDSAGNELWVRRFVECESRGTQVAINKVNGDVIVGMNGECMVVICYDSDGNFRWKHDFGTGVFFLGSITKLLIDATGDVYATGRILIPYEPWGPEHTWAIRTMKFDADGLHLWTNTYGDTEGLPPFDQCRGVDMAIDDSENVYLFIQQSLTNVVLRCTGSESETILTLPSSYSEPSSMSIKLLENNFYLSYFDDGFYHTKKYNTATRELLWEKEDIFDPSVETSNYPAMQVDEADNVYLAGPRADSYRMISYTPDGTERWSLYEFPSPPGAVYNIQNFNVWGEDKVYVAANRTNASVSDYLVAKYSIIPPPPPAESDTIIPIRLRDYERFAFGAYAPGRDWCWTGIDIDWTIICEQVPSMCPDFPVSTLTENGKMVWQQKFTKPANFLLPVDDKLPRQLSLSIPIGGSSQDVIVLDQNLVHRGISLLYVVTNGDKNWLDLKVETIQGKSVPFTMTLLNKEGQEIWQETFVAPLEKQIEAYVHEPGVALQFLALPEELQLSYFPNPFSETITVTLEASKKSPAQISVLSLQGEKILQEQVDVTGDHSINMKDQKPGFYILVLNLKDKEVRKLIELKK